MICETKHSEKKNTKRSDSFTNCNYRFDLFDNNKLRSLPQLHLKVFIICD